MRKGEEIDRGEGRQEGKGLWLKRGKGTRGIGLVRERGEEG